MSTPIDDIKARLDVAELIQGYIKIHKAGINYKAACPFHGEKTPSFFISPTRQIWHCFGCGRGGDIFKFVMEIEGMEFPDALRLLAQKTGVILKREDPQARSEKNRLYDVCEEAAIIFEKNLALTPAPKNYLKKRGVTENSIREFRLGFAPESWNFLLRSLTAKGFKKEEMEKAGLVIKSEDKGSYYDRFRSRLMFPISDNNGRTIGFGGRIFSPAADVVRSSDNKSPKGQGDKLSTTDNVGSGQAKYVNTPATPIYDKSSVLYGFDRAKQEIRSQNKVVVVEGYMDCLMSQQAGVKNTIAVSGTALTPQQLKTLRRLCDSMISSFDTDAAGDSATKRSLALASEFEFERKIAAIPSGKDPADAVLENPQSWLAAVEKAKPIVELFFEKTFREKNPNHIDGKKEISSILIPYIAELSNEVEKGYWVKELATRLEISEDSAWKEIKRGSRKPEPFFPSIAKTETIKKIPTRRDMIEERLLTLLPLVSPEIRERELASHHLIFSTPVNQEIFNVLKNNMPHITFTPDILKEMDMLKFKGEVLAGITKNLENDFLACKKELETISIKEQLVKLGQEIQNKEKQGNHTELAVLLQNFQELAQRLKTLNIIKTG